MNTDRTTQYAVEASASTTIGSAIRPIPEHAVFLSVTRAEDEDAMSTTRFSCLMTPEQAVALAEHLVAAANSIPRPERTAQ